MGHTGNGGGFKNVLLLFPDDDLTIAVLTNTDAGSPTGVAVQIARAILGVGDAPRAERPLPAGAGAAYGGTYESDEARVTLFERDGTIRFRVKDDDAVGIPTTHLGEDAFAIDDRTVGRFLMKDGRARASAVYVHGLFMDAMMRVRE